MNDELIYNIVEQRLSGRIGCLLINCTAGSGGRAGTRTKNAENWWLKNNALATRVHTGAHLFGPLPQGYYHMHPHEKHKNMVRLDPFPSNLMFGRFGFLIHRRGRIGSHGCIVPYDDNDVVRIYNGVKKYLATRKKKPVLEVIAVGSDVDLQFRTA
jgi:hypothetical protein